jgi:hypothetical protein
MLLDGTTTLDQAPPKPLVVVHGVTQQKYEEDYVLELVDRVIGQSLEEGNFQTAWFCLEKFRSMNKASSLGACKVLHGVKVNWDKVPHEEGDTFIEEAIRNSGYAELTVERYVSVWEFLTGNYIPEQFRENIWGQTMRCLLKEASLVVDQEYELDGDDWLKLSEAIDENVIADVCAKVKGKPRNKNHMSLKIDEEGDVWVYQGGNEGFLMSLPVRDEREFMQKAVRRVVRELGITKKNEY